MRLSGRLVLNFRDKGPDLLCCLQRKTIWGHSLEGTDVFIVPSSVWIVFWFSVSILFVNVVEHCLRRLLTHFSTTEGW